MSKDLGMALPRTTALLGAAQRARGGLVTQVA